MIVPAAGVFLIRRNGEKLRVPLPPLPCSAVSQGAALGPALQPHELFVAVTVPASVPDLKSPLPPRLPVLFKLPTMREKLIVRLPRSTRIPPPPSFVAAVAPSELPIKVTLLTVVNPSTLPLIYNPPPPLDPPLTFPETLFFMIVPRSMVIV